jgi:hypothetical protein
MNLDIKYSKDVMQFLEKNASLLTREKVRGPLHGFTMIAEILKPIRLGVMPPSTGLVEIYGVFYYVEK